MKNLHIKESIEYKYKNYRLPKIPKLLIEYAYNNPNNFEILLDKRIKVDEMCDFIAINFLKDMSSITFEEAVLPKLILQFIEMKLGKDL